MGLKRVGFKFDAYHDRGVGSLDLASAYLRAAGLGVVARYLVATGPLLLAGWMWIDVVAAEDRQGVAGASTLVVGGLIWRWAGLVWVQAAVMRDIGIRTELSAGRVATAVLGRLASHVMMGWGGVAILPALLGFYFSSFVTVMLLDPKHGTGAALKVTGGLVWNNLGQLWKLATVKFVLFFMGLLSAALVQALLLWTVLPSILGMDTTDLQLAARGVAWWLSLGFLTWAVFDLFWSVASVFEFEQLQARRTGGDLNARLIQLQEVNP